MPVISGSVVGLNNNNVYPNQGFLQNLVLKRFGMDSLLARGIAESISFLHLIINAKIYCPELQCTENVTPLSSAAKLFVGILNQPKNLNTQVSCDSSEGTQNSHSVKPKPCLAPPLTATSVAGPCPEVPAT